MSLNIKDRIYQETETEGTGTLTLIATKQGYQGFVALPNGSTTYYCITNNTDWEVGQGQYLNAGTDTLSRTLLSSSTGALLNLKGASSVFCTYPAEKAVLLNFDGNIYLPNANIQGQKFIGDGSGLVNIDASGNDLVPEAPDDGETYARNNETWVSISDSAGIPDAPVDGLQYGRQDGEWTETLTDDDFYTKTEIDAQQKTQDDDIIENNDDIARQQIEINNQQTSIDKNTSDINTDSTRIATNATNISTNTGNISSNTTAIGTLSGQVSQNSDDIAELQDSIFFSSAYSADYPSLPNRDPEDGNMYLQNFAMFTYSYADATQIFASKTDESGNVRQFTAIKAGDSIVLNEVDSPNYGRYELVSVEDVSDSYVVMNVIPKLGQGTVITGSKVAFQAFPKPGSDAGGIPEAPVDGKQYGRQDATWTEVVNGEAEPLVWESDPSRVLNVTYTNSETVPIYISVYVHTSPASLVNLIVDGQSIATVGDNYSSGVGYDTMFGVVPAGGTYQMTGANTNAVTGFYQAKVVGGGSSGGGEVQPPSIFKADCTISQALATANTKIIYNNVLEDTDDNYDASAGRYIAKEEGWYRVTAKVRRNGTGTSAIAIYKNNVVVSYGDYPGTDGDNPISEVNDIVQMNVNDYIEIFTQGSFATTLMGPSNFSVTKVNGATSNGSGETIDILPVLMSGRVNGDGSVLSGEGFTSSVDGAGAYTITYNTPIDKEYVVSLNSSSGAVASVYGETNNNFKVGFFDINGSVALPNFQFALVSEETIAVGDSGTELPVILKATFSTTSSIPNNAWTPITFDVADVDTNDGLDVTNKWYKPNVAGYYNVALSTQAGGTGLTRGISGVWKNDERVQQGTESYNDAVPISSITSLTNTIVYCNGTTDYIQPKVLCAGASDLELQSGYGTQLNISRVASSSGGVEEAKLCKEIYPNNYTAFSSQTFALLDNSTLTVNVKAGRKYIVTGGTDLTIQNITAVNTTGYMKIAISEDGGAYVDTRINVAGGAKTADGGTGWIGALERTCIYEPTTSASIKISMYGKVGGAGASCAFNENTIRIQEV